MTPGLEIVDATHGTFIAPPDDLITNQLVRYGSHAGGELAAVLSVVRAGDVVVDVGAHIGTFTVPLARAVGPHGRVIAFEPFEASYRLLELNVEINGLAGVVMPRPFAVAPPDSHWVAVTPDPANTGGTYLESIESGQIASVALDDWLARNGFEHVDLLKIDTEGMECLVLETAAETIAASHPIIYMEVAPGLVERFGGSVTWMADFLQQRSYVLFRNVGSRQSRGVESKLARIDTVDIGEFLDVLAVPPQRLDRVDREVHTP